MFIFPRHLARIVNSSVQLTETSLSTLFRAGLVANTIPMAEMGKAKSVAANYLEAGMKYSERYLQHEYKKREKAEVCIIQQHF